MKKNELFTALQQIQPDAYMKERLRQKVLGEQKKRPPLRYAVTAVCLAAVCLLSVWVTADRHAQQPEVTESEPSAFINSFSIRAYAADRAMSVDGTPTAQTDFRIATPIPQARIERGKLNTYEDNGKTVSAYEVSYGGNGISFEAIGEHIKAVTIFTQNGHLTYWDFQTIDKMKENGTYYAVQFTLPQDCLTGQDKALYDQFKKLWESGALDAYKKTYFAGKSTNLRDYAHCSVKRLESGEIEVGLVTEETLAQVHQSGQVVTMRGQEGGKTLWRPETALEKAAEYPAIPFDKLPKDIVTVEVEFEDGTIQTKTIEIRFDKDGNTLIQALP